MPRLQSLLFLLLLSNQLFASGDTSVIKKVSEITKLEDCKLPQQMFYRIKKMNPAEIGSLQEELQQPILDSGVEKLLTIKLRFIANNIMGYMKEAPMSYSNQTVISDKRINIPIKWVCTPDSASHEQHEVLSSEIKNYELNFHCKNWKQKDEEAATPEASFGKPPDDVVPKKKKKKLFIF
jgi:uncharacterized protein YueI